jgi:hypothetical protein
MNAAVDLGLGYDFEFFDEVSEHTCGSMDTASATPSIMSLPVPTLPPSTTPCTTAPLGLPIGKLNLKLNATAVASAWNSISGNAPVFRMPRSNLITAAANIPSLEARTQSLSVETQEGWMIKDGSMTTSNRPSTRNNSPFLHGAGPSSMLKPRSVGNIAPSARPQASRPPRKTSSSSPKRKSGGKSSDKRPRIKGRFVRRDELERFNTAATTTATDIEGKINDETLLVPDAGVVTNSHSTFSACFEMPESIFGPELQPAYLVKS